MHAENSDVLAFYVRVASRHPPLAREREYELARLSRSGDENARRLLINHNVAFVLSMARRYADKGVRLDDIIQEGMIGLLKAVEHFDPEKGNRFSTYAAWWIRAFVQKLMREQRAVVKAIVSQPGAEQFPLPRDFSLDTPMGDDDESTHADRLEDTNDPGAEQSFSDLEFDEAVSQRLNLLKKRIGYVGWRIVEERLMADPPRTLEEIGKDVGLSRERVRQVEKTLKQFLERAMGEFAET